MRVITATAMHPLPEEHHLQQADSLVGARPFCPDVGVGVEEVHLGGHLHANITKLLF